MQITLRDELARFIEREVRSGRYRTPEAVVSAALALLKDHEEGQEFTPEHRAYLQTALEEGAAAADRGDFVEMDLAQIKARGRRRLTDSQRESR